MNNSNPRAILVLSYSYRNVAVFRDQCDSYEGLLTLARSTFPAVQKAPAEDIVVQGCHPHYPTMGTSIEMSKEIWEACCARVTHVTFVVKSEKPESVG